MTVIICSRSDCLNQNSKGCTANLVHWAKGKCQAYLGSRESMCPVAPPMERRHGSLTNKPTQLR